MKKILFVCSLLAAVGAAEAAVTSSGTLVAGANTVSATACTLLASDVSVTLSTGNIGAYQCSTNTANIGVAVASTAGKNNVYSLGSTGGAITITPTRASPVTTDLDSAASSSAGDTLTVQTQTTNTGGDTSAYR